MALILASTAGSEVYTSFEDIGLATVIIAEPEQFQGSKNLIAIRNELSLKGSSQMRPKRSDMNKSQFLYSFHTQRSPTHSLLGIRFSACLESLAGCWYNY